MSNQIIGNLKLPQTIPVLGQLGKLSQVKVNVKSLVNRETKASTIKKYLKNGFDFKKFVPPVVAQYPDGKQYLLDGDHRRAMWEKTFPLNPMMPCFIINVVNDQEYHLLFVEINAKNRKTANKEEVFVHEVLAGIPSAVTTERNLKNAGLSVYGAPGPQGTVGAPNSPNVTVGAFRNAMRHGGNFGVNVSRARTAAQIAWPTNLKKINGELLEALTICYSLYPDLSNGSKIQTDFELFLDRIVGPENQSNIAYKYKSEGGRVHHRHGESIAKGMMMHFRKVDLQSRGGCSLQWKQKIINLKPLTKMLED